MISNKFKASLTQFAKRAGLQKALPLIMEFARECAYITPAKRAKKSDADLGASRIGGHPDLPKGLRWPTFKNEKGKTQLATFLAQLNLADIPGIADFPLPKTGYLWLFRCHSGNAESMIAIHRPATTKLLPAIAASTASDNPISLRFEKGITLQLSGNSFLQRVQPHTLLMDDWRKFEETPEGCLGWIGGHAFPIENDLYRLTAFQQLGKPKAFWADHWKSMEEYEEAPGKLPNFVQGAAFDRWEKGWKAKRPVMEWICNHRAEIDAEAAQWQILATFGRAAFGRGAFDIGDAMSLDIFIKSADLAANNFDRLVAHCFPVL